MSNTGEAMIETQRLILRRWRLSDINFLSAILSDADVMEFSDRGPLDDQEVQAWLRNAIAVVPEQGVLGARAIELKHDGSVIGYVSLLNDRSRIDAGEAELGLRLAKRYWRQGYASEAADRLIEAAFDDPAIVRIVGIADPNNHRSVRLLERLGMVFEREIEFEGYDHPDRLYALNRAT